MAVAVGCTRTLRVISLADAPSRCGSGGGYAGTLPANNTFNVLRLSSSGVGIHWHTEQTGWMIPAMDDSLTLHAAWALEQSAQLSLRNLELQQRRLVHRVVCVLRLQPLGGGSLRTCTRSRLDMTYLYLESVCSYRRTDSLRRINVDRVLVLNTPPLTQTRGGGGDSTSVDCLFSITPLALCMTSWISSWLTVTRPEVAKYRITAITMV